jgi:hypothetical protein
MQQKRLSSGKRLLYSFCAVAKSTAGRGNPSYLLATRHAPRVFFYVVALAHLLTIHRLLGLCIDLAMVAQAGLTSVRPVSNKAGISTPVWATTHKRGNFGGSNNQYLLEAAIMATTLSPLHPQFTYLFAAVRRAEVNASVCKLRTVATTERAARRQFACDYVLLFAGRLPARVTP